MALSLVCVCPLIVWLRAVRWVRGRDTYKTEQYAELSAITQYTCLQVGQEAEIDNMSRSDGLIYVDSGCITSLKSSSTAAVRSTR